MPRIKLSPELKEAIKDLPVKEKTKLLLRLIPKDDLLVEQLEFQHLEDGSTVDERKSLIIEYIDNTSKYLRPTRYIDDYLSEIKPISSRITRHVRVTKDKIGDIEMNLYMIRTILSPVSAAFEKAMTYEGYRIGKYIVQRTIRISKAIAKLHEDFLLEFADDLMWLGHFIDNSPPLKKEAIEFELDLEAIKNGNVPEEYIPPSKK